MVTVKNFFRLEVFKNGQIIFDKMTPTLLINQIIGQWSAPHLGYSYRLTFDDGRQISSDELLNHPFAQKAIHGLQNEMQTEMGISSGS